jgi:Ca2+-binding EF-hand superfamily protein
MRTLLGASLVLIMAATASAQFSKGAPASHSTKKNAEADGAKTADKTAGAADNTANPPAAKSSAAANKLFAALDLDGDGVISKTELRKAIVSLKKLDTDNDGQLTAAECGISADGSPVADANGANANGVANDPALNGAGANGAANTAFSGHRNEAMAGFFALDKNHDGKLTPDEVPPQMMGMLRGADLNHDGAIDAAEFAAVAQKMGDRMKAAYAAGLNGNNAGMNNGRGR